MIPYEELERALSRWRARRAGAVESTDAVVDRDKTPPPGTLSATPFETRDSTGELELSDAEVDEAQ